ncbi:class I SAM-dependent methyltransferase [Paenarthrobacter sp. PH39-S1]|uniref:class I SAM-dependent methyltransferase n=1 Tax=Paenarthrobacter sp. PH39-S1 TaxID=3046204 RepID=UPI0024B9F2F8|nr:class I SAM-dependent methyltransferase [Paenarthrobacter sp. PH39-S1]MDJ0354598.1 class I SAM-dependent methyltransferase [Paenarthrobacter sp. PH39-S1]
MDTEANVVRHYSRGDLQERLLEALQAEGRDPDHLHQEDLAGADEFHIGGIKATEDLASSAGIHSGSRVLDVGSGIGGPARHFAHRFGATVHGVDLTPEFVQVARSLTELTGLGGQVTFSQGSALALPFGDDEFDVATMLHVGMNIDDKAALFAEVFRVLKPGGVFAVYDVMRMSDDEPTFPLPWSTVPADSFVGTPLEYSEGMEAAGFAVDSERNRRDFGIAFMERGQARTAEKGPSPLGPLLVLGPDGPPRMANLLAAFRAGVLAPVEIFARKP